MSFFCKENVYPIFKHRAVGMDEGRKRVIGIIAGILVANHITWLTIWSAGRREVRGLTR